MTGDCGEAVGCRSGFREIGRKRDEDHLHLHAHLRFRLRTHSYAHRCGCHGLHGDFASLAGSSGAGSDSAAGPSYSYWAGSSDALEEVEVVAAVAVDMAVAVVVAAAAWQGFGKHADLDLWDGRHCAEGGRQGQEPG